MATDPASPQDLAALQRQIAELQAQMAAALRTQSSGGQDVNTGANSGSINTGTQTNTHTDGGAVVEGAVRVRNGHFIGRDFIEVVNHVAHSGEDPEEAKSVIALYLHALAADLTGLKLGQVDASVDGTRQAQLELADIYVPLNIKLKLPKASTLASWLASGPNYLRTALESSGDRHPVSALEALAHHRELTVLGEAGSGKSTFGASVLLALAQAWQGRTEKLAGLGEGWTHGAKLPVRVVLRRFAETLPPGVQPARAGDLWAFISRDLDDSGFGLSANTIEFVKRIARNHGALILLDGLDECGDTSRRGRVLHAVRELIKSAGPDCRFLLTARPYAWPDGADPAQGVYALAQLNNAQIEQFIRAWYEALVKRQGRPPGEAESKCADLIGAYQRADLLPIARNPLLLTLMTTLHSNRGSLPDDRADLYDESVNLLLLRWNQHIGADKALLDELAVPGLKLTDLREVLEELAFKVHEDSVGKEGAADVGEDRLVRAFRPLLNKSKDKADLVVEFIEKRAGILIGQGERGGERQFTFPHRTFQEFLAACHLAQRDDLSAECLRLARADAGHWQVVLPLAARLAKLDRGTSAVDELVGSQSVDDFRKRQTPTDTDFTCALLAGMQLQEIGLANVQKRERTRAIAGRVAGWLAASLPVHPDEGGSTAIQRAAAGNVLAALGDPRFDPERFHLPADDTLGFAAIAADPAFVVGTRKADGKRVAQAIGTDVRNNEFNRAPTPTPHFHIARYPVTVAQFQAFVDATQTEPGDADALRDPDNRPVRWVSWHEAGAYCAWLTEMLANSPLLAQGSIARLVREQGWVVALPNEPEWEKAARGGLANAVFSWGDAADPQRANYDDSSIDNTSAVGCFPANGYGLYDMLGNVWEWTRSLYGEYPYPVDDSQREDRNAPDDRRRVVRGGSWGGSRGGVRCAYRFRVRPGSRGDFLGFRVVLRSSPVLKR